MILFEYIIKGGWLMIPIIGAMIAGFYLIYERYAVLKHYREQAVLINKVIPLVDAGEDDKALKIVKDKKGAIPHVLKVGIQNLSESETRLENRLKQAFYEEFEGIQRNISTIHIIASALPMLGLLGTVTGMITVFKAIAVVGVGDPQALAGGISQALITTQSGLGAAIPVLFGHHYLQEKAEGIMIEMKRAASTLPNIARRRKQDNVG